jgi:hypothetical protein
VNDSSDPITGGLPWFEMRPTSYAAIGDPTFIPMETEDHNHQIAGSLTKMMGAHSIKMGGGIVFRLFGVQQSQYPRGLFAFDSSVTNSGTGSGGNTFASLLLGLPSVEQRTHFPIHPLNRSKEPSVFVQDDWRATSWLTLNLGLRYEIYTPITEAENRMAAFRSELGKIIVASDSDPTGRITRWRMPVNRRWLPGTTPFSSGAISQPTTSGTTGSDLSAINCHGGRDSTASRAGSSRAGRSISSPTTLRGARSRSSTRRRRRTSAAAIDPT